MKKACGVNCCTKGAARAEIRRGYAGAGSFPLKLPVAVVAPPLTSANALVPVRVINVDLADLVLGQ
jgi:hypothetical protein